MCPHFHPLQTLSYFISCVDVLGLLRPFLSSLFTFYTTNARFSYFSSSTLACWYTHLTSFYYTFTWLNLYHSSQGFKTRPPHFFFSWRSVGVGVFSRVKKGHKPEVGGSNPLTPQENPTLVLDVYGLYA